MIRKDLETHIVRHQQKGEWILPFYDELCLSNIPATLFDLFGLPARQAGLPARRSFLAHIPEVVRKSPKNPKIVLLLLDGFGYDQWLSCYRRLPFLRAMTEKGTLLPLTTVFPSTTAAAITSLQTGLTPQEHALFEWFLYFKEVDEVVMSLPFSAIKRRAQDELLERGVDPRLLLDAPSISHLFQKRGIHSFAFVRSPLAKSAYTKRAFRGSAITGYRSMADLVVKLRRLIAQTRGPSYFYVYWGEIDSLAHAYNPLSEEYETEVSNFALIFQKELVEKLPRSLAEETMLMVTADHGQIPVKPLETVYLNRYPSITRHFEISHRGKPILPCGSPRDVFLHVAYEHLAKTRMRLERAFGGRANAILVDDALAQGLFGRGKIHARFRERAGNVLVMPLGRQTVWYEHIKGKKFELLGHHGGLTRAEMLIPFAVARVSDLPHT